MSETTLTMYENWAQRLRPPENGFLEYRDERVVGLSLRILPSGRRTWYVMVMRRGAARRRREKLGTYPAMKLDAAREAATRARLDAGAAEASAPVGPLFAVAAAEFIEKYAKPRKKSWKEDDRRVRNVLAPRWGARPIATITRSEIHALLDDIAGKHPAEANRTLALLRKMFRWARSRDYVAANPCLEIEPPGVERSRDRVLSDDEIRAVWAAFGRLGADAGAIFRLRLVTAQRGGEIKAMAWDDVDLDAGWWAIPPVKAKNGKEHRVPLTAAAVAILATRAKATGGEGWVFPGTAAAGHIVYLQKPLAKARELAGVSFWGHDLRRTAATGMAAAGVDRFIIAKVLNHSDGAVTAIYDRHRYDAEKRAALEKWAARLKQILKKKPAAEG